MSHFHEAVEKRGAFSSMGVRSTGSKINRMQGLPKIRLRTFQNTLKKTKVFQEGKGRKINLLIFEFLRVD